MENAENKPVASQALIDAAPEMLELLKSLTFVAETLAHSKGLERELLPLCDKARALIDQIEGE